jgi:excisionase family DNA binding protein
MQTTEQPLPRLLNAREVSDATGLPRWRIYELSRRGELPAVAVGSRSYRYSAPAIREWIAGGGSRDEG